MRIHAIILVGLGGAPKVAGLCGLKIAGAVILRVLLGYGLVVRLRLLLHRRRALLSKDWRGILGRVLGCSESCAFAATKAAPDDQAEDGAYHKTSTGCNATYRGASKTGVGIVIVRTIV